MPRQLTFKIKRKEFSIIPVKIDRKKLYGWTEINAEDENGKKCTLVTTDQTGSLIITKGGTSIGILSPENEWVDRSSLITVNEDGSPAKIKPSSYSTIIELKKKVSEEEFLDHSITDFYELTDSPAEFVKLVGNDIYIFDYTYLDSYETTPAFIMAANGILFLLSGYKNKFEYLCLGDCETIDEDNDDYMEIDDDIDFTMF